MTKKELRHHERMEKRRKYIYIEESHHHSTYYISISLFLLFIASSISMFMCIYVYI